MNSVFSWLPADGWQRLTCDALWQSTLLGAIGFLTARFFIRQAAARAWLLLMALTACAVAPLASLAAREQGWTLFHAPQQSVPDNLETYNGAASNQAATTQRFDRAAAETDRIEFNYSAKADLLRSTEVFNSNAQPSAKSSLSPGPSIDSTRSRSSAATVFNVFGIAWLCLSSALALRLALSFATAYRLLLSSVACQHKALLDSAAEAAQRVGLRQPPALLVSGRIATPMIFTFGQPRLFVPVLNSGRAASSTADSTTIDWTAAFTHELAHVVRGDGWSRLWNELVLIALPLAPLVWLLRRSFRIACEEACDDWVLATGTEAADFATTLTQWVNRRPQLTSLAAIGMSTTKSRVLRLLSIRCAPIVRIRRGRQWATIAMAALLTAGIAAAQSKSQQAEETPNDKKAAKSPEQPTPSSPPQQYDEKALADDPLLMLYQKRLAEQEQYLAENKERLEAIKSGKVKPEEGELEHLQADFADMTDWIKSYKERIEKRKIELKSRANEEAQETKANQNQLPAYVIEPPDILLLEANQLVPKKPLRIIAGDKVKLAVEGTKFDAPIVGTFQVDSAGEVVLGPSYGSVKIAGLTRREAQEAVTEQLKETLRDPVVALIIDEARLSNGISGKHLVGPDGTINLGVYGQVYVDGRTIVEAHQAIQEKLSAWFVNPKVSVDIYAYNSKVYYVIVQRERDEFVHRFPITGHETILDAIAQSGGAKRLSEAKIWIARPQGRQKDDQIINIDWSKLVNGSNDLQILPGDRIFISGATIPADQEPPGAAEPKSKAIHQKALPPEEVSEPPLSDTKPIDDSKTTPPTFTERYSRPGR